MSKPVSAHNRKKDDFEDAFAASQPSISRTLPTLGLRLSLYQQKSYPTVSLRQSLMALVA